MRIILSLIVRITQSLTEKMTQSLTQLSSAKREMGRHQYTDSDRAAIPISFISHYVYLPYRCLQKIKLDNKAEPRTQISAENGF